MLVIAGGIALSSAVAYALLPAKQAVHHHRFEPINQTVASDPAVAPMALARGTPDRLVVTLPCDVETPASGYRSSRPELWRVGDGEARSTLRFPDLGPPGAVILANGRATVSVGGDEVVTLPYEAAPGCVATATWVENVWTLTVSGVTEKRPGPAPLVTEAYVFGPAAMSPVTSITAGSRELGSSPTPVKWFSFLVAVGSIAFVIAGLRSIDPPASSSRPNSRFDRFDVAVGTAMVSMAVLVPLNIDDGWIHARLSGYSAHGDIVGIFTASSAPMPFGYWLEWLQHLWVGLSSQAVWWRLPAIAAGALTWRLVRSYLGSRFERLGWSAVTVFLVGFAAWGVTLRAEPVIAALLVGSLALARRFTETPRWGTLASWFGVVVLGVTGHPAGVVVLAPVLVSMKRIRAWIRGNRSSALIVSAVLLAFAAAVVAMFFIDADVASRVESIDAYRSDAHRFGVLDEPTRYLLLNDAPYATPLRRVSAGIAVVAALIVVVDASRRRSFAWRDRLAGSTLVVSLLLLSLTPSKWPSHFGVLLGIVAIVLASRVSGRRLREAWIGSSLLVAVGLWAWAVSTGWAVFDLRTSSWGPFASGLFPMPLGLVLIVGVLAVAAWSSARRRSGSSGTAMLAGVLVPILVLPMAVLVADAIRTPGWTFATQNVAALVGRARCGLGDELYVPIPRSVAVLDASAAPSPDADRQADAVGFDPTASVASFGYPRTGINRIRPVPGVVTLGTWVGDDPDAVTGGARTSWKVLAPSAESVAQFVMGGLALDGNAVGVQWGRQQGEVVAPLGIDLASGFEELVLDWRLVEFSVPDGADRVRGVLIDGTDNGGDAWVAATAPVSISHAPLSEVVGSRDVLVSVALAPYFPCISTPVIERGLMSVPDLIVQTWPAIWQTTFAGAAMSERYFQVRPVIDPPLRSEVIGAHAGDTDHFIYVSQEWLTGVPARITGDVTHEPKP